MDTVDTEMKNEEYNTEYAGLNKESFVKSDIIKGGNSDCNLKIGDFLHVVIKEEKSNEDKVLRAEFDPPNCSKNDDVVCIRQCNDVCMKDNTFNGVDEDKSCNSECKLKLLVFKKMETLSALSTKSEMDAIKYFQIFNVIPKTKKCPANHDMIMARKNTSYVWRCQKGECKITTSIKSGTWLEGTGQGFLRILKFIYCWSEEKTNVKFCKDELNMGKCTVIDFNNYLREVCANHLLNNPVIIGGEGNTVEISEALFSRRKRGGNREPYQQWAFGGICRETKESFLYSVPNCMKETLFMYITSSILPGTTIISSQWEAYRGIDEISGFDYKHRTVSHNESFLDQEQAVHLQNIESLWNLAKLKNKHQWCTTREMLDSYLCEFMWRHKHSGENLFQKILTDISNFNG